MAWETTGGTIRVIFPCSSGRNTWKHSLTTFRSIVWPLCLNPAINRKIKSYHLQIDLFNFRNLKIGILENQHLKTDMNHIVLKINNYIVNISITHAYFSNIVKSYMKC